MATLCNRTLTPESQTISKQAVYFAAAEVKLYGPSPGALQSKFSAIRWMHVRDYHPDPFKDMATLTAWLSDYAKRSPPHSQS